jgi:hypothetical protein
MLPRPNLGGQEKPSRFGNLSRDCRIGEWERQTAAPWKREAAKANADGSDELAPCAFVTFYSVSLTSSAAFTPSLLSASWVRFFGIETSVGMPPESPSNCKKLIPLS